MYNKSNIKQFKGRNVEMIYIPRLGGERCLNKLVGLIIANTDKYIIFKHHKEEINLFYSQIVEINEPNK